MWETRRSYNARKRAYYRAQYNYFIGEGETRSDARRFAQKHTDSYFTWYPRTPRN